MNKTNYSELAKYYFVVSISKGFGWTAGIIIAVRILSLI